MKKICSAVKVAACAAILGAALPACDTLLDPSVSMGVNVGSGGIVPYGNINLSTVFSPWYDGPYWDNSGVLPSPARPWRPPQTINNPPPRQPGGSFPGQGVPVNPSPGPVLRPSPSVPVRPPALNIPSGNGQRPGGNAAPVQPGGR